MSVYVPPHWERIYESERKMSVYVPPLLGEKNIKVRKR